MFKNELEVRNFGIFVFYNNVFQFNIVVIYPIKRFEIIENPAKGVKEVVNVNCLYVFQYDALIVSVLTESVNFVKIIFV